MRLLVQILAEDNEAEIAEGLEKLPRKIPGIDDVEWLILDDASTDSSRGLAQARGADHVVRLPRRRGKGRAFMLALETCLELGADFIVNVDLEGRVPYAEIPKLLVPLVRGEADVTVGRPCRKGGFFALTRDAASSLAVLGRKSYAAEARWQARFLGLAVVDVALNEGEEESRIALDSAVAVAVTTLLYRPVPVFGAPAAVFLLAGALLRSPWSFCTGIMLTACGAIAYLMSANLRHLEALQSRLLRLADTLPVSDESWAGEGPSSEYLSRYDPNRDIH